MAAHNTMLPSTFVYHCTSPLVAAFCYMIFFWKVAMAALATMLTSTFVYRCTSPLVAAFAHEQALDSRGPC